MILIDQLCYSSKLRYTNTYLKAFFAISTLFICVASRSIIVSLITLLTTGSLTIVKGGTSFVNYRKLMGIPLLFIIMSTITIIFNISTVPLSFLALPFGKYYLTVSLDSLLFAVRLFLTALGSVSCLYFLSLSTPMTDFLMVLKKIRCPFLLIELMLLIYRFIFVLLDLSSSLSTSMKSRLGNKDFKTSCYSIGNLMAILLVRSLQKSSYLYDAMESRCYDGNISLLTEISPVNKRDLIFVLGFELFLIITAVIAKGYYI